MSLPPITFATDTELRDAQFAEKLARRRRRLLRWSLPVVVLAGLLALKLLSAVGLNLIGTHSFERANYSTAAARYVNTQFLNVVQPWKAHFNEGTADYSAGKFFAAGQQLQVALEKVPKTGEDQPRGPAECAVRVNYSLALEGIGDETSAVGDAPMAEEYYTQALDMLADCADSGEGGEQAEEAQERQEQSRQESQEQQEQEEGSGEDPDSGGGEPDPEDPEEGQDPEDPEEGQDPEDPADSEDPQQQELEDRNQRANESDEEDEGTGIGDGSGQNW